MNSPQCRILLYSATFSSTPPLISSSDSSPFTPLLSPPSVMVAFYSRAAVPEQPHQLPFSFPLSVFLLAFCLSVYFEERLQQPADISRFKSPRGVHFNSQAGQQKLNEGGGQGEGRHNGHKVGFLVARGELECSHAGWEQQASLSPTIETSRPAASLRHLTDSGRPPAC